MGKEFKSTLTPEQRAEYLRQRAASIGITMKKTEVAGATKVFGERTEHDEKRAAAKRAKGLRPN